MTYWLNNIQLPQWLSNTPQGTCVSVAINDGVVTHVVPESEVEISEHDSIWEGNGRLVVSGLSEIHIHLDKTYTRHRLGYIGPGLLNAIEAMKSDSQNWNAEDLLQRMTQALEQLYANGVTHVRTHIDWIELTSPAAWLIVDDLMKQWRGKIDIERVALIPLTMFENTELAMHIARSVEQSEHSLLGAFIHSSNYSHTSMENLFSIASELNLDLDLHINEELQSADGLVWLADYLDKYGFSGSITCGHACGLHALGSSEQIRVLRIFARHDVTLVALPTTNLLLQDADIGRTPTHRGLTMVKEAKAEKVDVMFSSDNVADAFCPYGDYNPISVLKLASVTAQLDMPFENWSQTICRLKPIKDSPRSVLIGQPADFILFEQSNVHVWPEHRDVQVMRKGKWLNEKQS